MPMVKRGVVDAGLVIPLALLALIFLATRSVELVLGLSIIGAVFNRFYEG